LARSPVRARPKGPNENTNEFDRRERQVRASSTATALLEARGIARSSDVDARIEGCNDAATLARWLVQATTAASGEEATKA
jgi:hypothetical protein